MRRISVNSSLTLDHPSTVRLHSTALLGLGRLWGDSAQAAHLPDRLKTRTYTCAMAGYARISVIGASWRRPYKRSRGVLLGIGVWDQLEGAQSTAPGVEQPFSS